MTNALGGIQPLRGTERHCCRAVDPPTAKHGSVIVVMHKVAVTPCRLSNDGSRSKLVECVSGYRLTQREHAGTATSENLLHTLADATGDTIHLNLRVAIVDHAHYATIAGRTLGGAEKSVEKGVIVIGKPETKL